jgi:hypothetical protein
MCRSRFGGVTLQHMCAGESEVRQRTHGVIQLDAAMVKNLLKFRGRF